MARPLNNQWWIPKPMTEEDMQIEISMSRIKGEPHQEFTEECVNEVLKALNLNGDKYNASRTS